MVGGRQGGWGGGGLQVGLLRLLGCISLMDGIGLISTSML